jgi:hypothetical protein
MSEFMPTGDLVNSGLSELETQILEFERTWWRHAGAKESSIKELFNRPAALTAQPLLVKRLLRLRDQRTTTRSSTKLGFTL